MKCYSQIPFYNLLLIRITVTLVSYGYVLGTKKCYFYSWLNYTRDYQNSNLECFKN